MLQPDRPAWIEVDLSAIVANISAVRQYVSPATEVLAVVKANAYGHGLVPVAKAALKGGAAALGVALLQEGIALRKAGIRAPVVVLAPALPEQAECLIAHNLSQTTGGGDAIRALATAANRRNTRARVHLKVDTGMGRVGLSPDDALGLAKKIATNPHLFFEGIATHVAWERAEDMDKARHQIKTFVACTSKLAHLSIRWRHAANSAMTVYLPESHFDLVRVGLLAYGVPPTRGAGSLALLPALSLKARIAQVRDFAPGQTLSYGGTYAVARPSRIALVPLGYADGYSRGLSNNAHVLIRGKPCPVVGAVCMDMILIDVTDIPSVRVGEEVVLLGPQGDRKITVDDLAHWANCISHEVIAQLGTRLPRRYVQREQKE